MPEKTKKRILIVDDSPVVLAQLADDFGEEFDVTTAESGDEVVEILENLPTGADNPSAQFDLIITDLNMPGMNGFELAQYIRERNKLKKFTPVIMLSSQHVSKDEARKHGCAAAFSKSDQTRLVSMVRMLLTF